MIRHNGEAKIMKKCFGIVLNIFLIFMLIAPVGAKDRLAIGYSSTSGVFAGLWVAQEGRIFEKYDIDSHLVLIASGSLMVRWLRLQAAQPSTPTWAARM